MTVAVTQFEFLQSSLFLFWSLLESQIGEREEGRGRSSMATTDANRARKNFRQVQKLVPEAVEIVDQAIFVSVYAFDQSEAAWEREEIEGPLFLVQRTPDAEHPESFALLVVNRSSSTNLLKFIGPTFEVDSSSQSNGEDKFLIFRCDKDVYGLWFPQDEQRESITKRVESITNSLRKNRAGSPEMPQVLQQMFGQVAVSSASDTPLKDNTPSSFSGPNADANFALSKEQMKDVLLKLVQTDKFVDILHAQYLKTTQRQAPPGDSPAREQPPPPPQQNIMSPSPLRHPPPPMYYGSPGGYPPPRGPPGPPRGGYPYMYPPQVGQPYPAAPRPPGP